MVFDPSEFTDFRGQVRGSFTSYKRSRNGGLEITLVVVEEDKHTALDIVDGGDIVDLIEVRSIPRDDEDEDEYDD